MVEERRDFWVVVEWLSVLAAVASAMTGLTLWLLGVA